MPEKLEGSKQKPDRFPGFDEEEQESLEAELQSIREAALGNNPTEEDQKIADDAAEEFRILQVLGRTFERLQEENPALFEQITTAVSPDAPVAEPENFVFENLSNPGAEGFELRSALITYFSDYPQVSTESTRVVSLVKELAIMVSKGQ